MIDGEIVVALRPDGRPSFQALRHRGLNAGLQIVFYAFDVLFVNGRDFMSEPCWPAPAARHYRPEAAGQIDMLMPTCRPATMNLRILPRLTVAHWVRPRQM